MCRLVNLRRNQLIEVEVQMVMSYNETVDGKLNGVFILWHLERDKIGILSLNWTLVILLTEESPFYEKSLTELQACRSRSFCDS